MSHAEGSAINPRERCPSCGGKLAGQFEKCQHCRADISWVETEAGTLPCKRGREAYVKNQVAAVFQQRRVQAEQQRVQSEQQRVQSEQLAKQRVEQERQTRQRQKKTLVRLLPIACAIAILALSVLYLQRRSEALSMKKAADVQQALSDGDYAAALQLDPINAEALSMKKKAADVQQALLDGDYVSALQLDPINAKALSMKKAADVQRVLSDGDYVSALQLDPNNAEALSMKKAADVQRALSDGDYVAALQLDPINAEALSMKKKAADVQRALSDGDYVSALQLDPINAKALSMKKAADVQRFEREVRRVLAKGDYNAVLQLDPTNAVAGVPRSTILRLPPITNSIGMKLKWLPLGEFQMGGRVEDKVYVDGEPIIPHKVTLTKSFRLGIHEVTQAQYHRVMGSNPSGIKGADNPVDQVSWDNAVEFCRKLSALPVEKAAGRVYRLPTEAEWEYACRAGTTTEYSSGDDLLDLKDYAWFSMFKYVDETQPIGGKKPNSWGLYDMHGNVWEWCQDWYGDYPGGELNQGDIIRIGPSVTDPGGPTTGECRVLRGGSLYDDDNCRSSFRIRLDPSLRYDYYGSIGFRVSLSPSSK